MVGCRGNYTPAVMVGAIRTGRTGVIALIAIPFEEFRIGTGTPPASAFDMNDIVIGRRECLEIVLNGSTLEAIGIGLEPIYKILEI